MTSTPYWIGLALALVGCNGVTVSNLDPDEFTGEESCATRAASFSVDVVPIYSSENCANSGCHGGGASSGGLNLEGDTATIYAASTGSGRISTASPAESKLLRKPLGLDSHGGGKVFSGTTDSNYQTIFCWISAGAQND